MKTPSKKMIAALLDQVNAKNENEPLTNEELEALFFWSGYSSEEDMRDYEAI